MTGGKDHRIINHHSRDVRVLARHFRRLVGVFAVATLAIGAPAAVGVIIPPSYPSGADASAPPADVGVAPAPPAVTTPATTPAVVAPDGRGLTLRSGGADVKALQRKLRVKGIRVPVDGKYGARTRAGVRILQRKWNLRATGIADAVLLARLGIKVRAVASTPAAAPAAPATARYLKVFPVNGKNQLTKSWGAFRASLQGQSHQGEDIMAANGTPTVAVADGTIKRLTRTETGLGGIYIWLIDNAGNEYYYAHLADIAPGLDAGSKVTAGQQIGTVGNTGDARYGAPHLHFEVHPGGGSAIDPYPDLIALDPSRGTAG